MSAHERPITNDQFLMMWQKQGPTEAILTYEVGLLEAQLADMEKSYNYIIAEKQAVTGADDWHDGAFRATDLAASSLVNRHGDILHLLELPRVKLPEKLSTTVSIGSRAYISQNKTQPYYLDIIGAKRLYPDSDDDIEIATPLSPLGRMLIGHKIGETIIGTLLGNREHTINILGSQPTSQPQSLE